jgi:hypothetical protein
MSGDTEDSENFVLNAGGSDIFLLEISPPDINPVDTTTADGN